MKKGLLVFFALVALLIASLYIFIPDTVRIRHSIVVYSTEQGLKRVLITNSNWENWWPGKRIANNNPLPVYTYNNSVYHLTDIKFNSLLISIKKGNLATTTSLILMPGTTDSAEIIWQDAIPVPYNPVKRLEIYNQANQLSKDLKAILQTMQSFFSAPENIYGFEIRKEPIIDSILVSTYATSKGEPSTIFVYELLAQLKKYIASQSAKETGFPMLNINTADSITYLARVAIPVNKKLKSSGIISQKLMPGGSAILVAEVKGGPELVKNAFRQMESYLNDHHRVAPGIPFLSLVTDRSKETDTSKWVTRVYFPVM